MGTPGHYIFSDVREGHTIRAFFSILPLLPIEGALLEGQEDLTEDWKDDLLTAHDLSLPQEAVVELLGPGTLPGSVEIMDVRKVAALNCSITGNSETSLRVGIEEDLPEPAPGRAWGLLLHDHEKNLWELQADTIISVEDDSPFDQDTTEGKISLLLAEVQIESTHDGAASDGGGCNTGLNPFPVMLLLILHSVRRRT